MNPILKVRDVCLSYHTLSGETPALSHISFDLMPGEFLSIVGPSGCGKSTLLNLIAGLLIPECGSITLDGKPVSAGFWSGAVFTKIFSLALKSVENSLPKNFLMPKNFSGYMVLTVSGMPGPPSFPVV